VIDNAGEPASGAVNNFFQGGFTFTSDSDTAQAGLDIRIGSYQAPNTQRQDLFSITDDGSGLDVGFFDTDSSGNFVEHTLAVGLSYSSLTSISYSILFVPGENNDVVTVSINGGAPSTFTSWESFYEFNEPSNDPTFVNTLSIQNRSQDAAPGLAGGGLLFTDLSFSSSDVPEPASYALLAGGLGLLAAFRRKFATRK